MNRRIVINYFWHALRLILAGVFIAASVYKIGSPGGFAHQIYNYKILPVWAINPVAIIVPWIQLFSGLFLLVNKGVKGASFWIVSMMAVFQVALASALFRGLDISCGCFDAGGEAATWLTFARDSLIFGVALLYFMSTLVPKVGSEEA